MITPAKQLAQSLVMLVFVCSGCINLERSAPVRHYFVIEIPHSASPASSTDRILLVSNLRISPRYADRSFVYRISDVGYESDYYNQFLTSPDTMVTEELRRGLVMSAPEFKFVVGPSNPLQSDYDLEGSINNLYGDFRDLNHPTAVLEIDFFLYKDNGANRTVVMQKRYTKSVPIKERSAEALVEGWDRALQEIVTALVEDLRAATAVDQTSVPSVSRDRDTSDGAGSR